jgi:hypothetical protein
MTTNKLPGNVFFFNYRYIPHTKSVYILLVIKLIGSFKLSPHPAIVPIEGAILFELPYLMHPKYSSGFVLVRSFDPKVPSELLLSLRFPCLSVVNKLQSIIFPLKGITINIFGHGQDHSDVILILATP